MRRSMSNKEAAEILENQLRLATVYFARGNGKSMKTLEIIEAVAKAIEVLKKTPDN